MLGALRIITSLGAGLFFAFNGRQIHRAIRLQLLFHLVQRLLGVTQLQLGFSAFDL